MSAPVNNEHAETLITNDIHQIKSLDSVIIQYLKENNKWREFGQKSSVLSRLTKHLDDLRENITEMTFPDLVKQAETENPQECLSGLRRTARILRKKITAYEAFSLDGTVAFTSALKQREILVSRVRMMESVYSHGAQHEIHELIELEEISDSLREIKKDVMLIGFKELKNDLDAVDRLLSAWEVCIDALQKSAASRIEGTMLATQIPRHDQDATHEA
jgi:hypothetical protein